MAKTTETLKKALEREGSTDQITICTPAILKLTKAQLSKILVGQDVDYKKSDEKSLKKLCRTRINKGQRILPWSDVKLSHEVDPNW